MRTRSSLTKSLHTVTVVTRVACDIATRLPYLTTAELAAAALVVLGIEWSDTTDATYAACVASVGKNRPPMARRPLSVLITEEKARARA